MNKTKFFFAGIAFLSMTLASCSSDEPANNGSDVFDGDQAFVKVSISMADNAAPGSRAGEDTDGDETGETGETGATNGYEYGSGNENNVNTLGFKFYSEDGSFYGYGKQVETPSVKKENTDESATGASNVEAKVEAVVALKVTQGSPKPKYVVAYVNFDDSDLKLPNELNLTDVSAKTSHINRTNDFAMTSSNFRTDEGPKGYATKVTGTSFKESAEEAKADDTPVEIYVERLAAKVVVEDARSEKNTAIENGDYKLTFVMDGWNLGGINISSYLIKNLESSWEDATLWTGWNAAKDYRCFWAKDVNYGTSYGIPQSTEPQLSYKSWNAGSSNKNALYCCENTFPERGTSTDNPYKVQPFVYVMGHYTVTKAGQLVNDSYLYEYAGDIYKESDMINIMLNASGTIVYEKKTGEDGTTYDGQSLADKVVIASYKDNNEKDVDASRVLLQLKSEVDLKDLYVTNPDSKSEDDKYIAATEVLVNNALAKAPVIAYGFKYDETKGGYLAYFPVLIQHLYYNKDFGENGTQPIGAYGIVRNHVYKLTITEIKNLGIGVFDPNVDIIPDEKAKTLYLGAKINILAWKLVSQDVKL